MKVVLLPQAQEDLDRIFEPLLGRILRQLRMLQEFPELGTAMIGPFAQYRSTIVAMFRIVYRIRPGRIEVAYVRHCSRRPPA